MRKWRDCTFLHSCRVYGPYAGFRCQEALVWVGTLLDPLNCP